MPAVILVAFAFALAAGLSSCTAESVPTAVPPTPTPSPTPTPTPTPPTAAEVLLATRDAMTNAGSAWFELTHQNGYLTVSGVQVDELGGAVNKDGADLTANASLGRLYIELQIKLVDGGVWVTNPLTGNWEDAGDPEQPVVWNLVDGITSIIDNITDPEFIEPPLIGQDFRIEANPPAAVFNDLFFSSVTSPDDVYVTALIDADTYVVHELVIEGILTSSDTWETTRTLAISRYGESFDIQPPN